MTALPSANVLPMIPRPKSTVVMVTPEIATRWLKKNLSNRALRNSLVAKYAEDMSAGRWALTGASISFDNSDRLIDGQHRLNAVVRAGVTVAMFVVRDLDPAAQQYTDTGAKRTLSDQLGMAGKKNAHTLASAARLAYAWSLGDVSAPVQSVSEGAIREFIDANNDLIEYAASVASALGGRGNIIPPSPTAAAIFALLDAGCDSFKVHAFFSTVAESATNGHGDPRQALIRRVATARQNRETVPGSVYFGMLIRAWNAHVQGKSLIKIQTNTRNGRVDVPAIRGGAR